MVDGRGRDAADAPMCCSGGMVIVAGGPDPNFRSQPMKSRGEVHVREGATARGERKVYRLCCCGAGRTRRDESDCNSVQDSLSLGQVC